MASSELPSPGAITGSADVSPQAEEQAGIVVVRPIDRAPGPNNGITGSQDDNDERDSAFSDGDDFSFVDRVRFAASFQQD